MTEQPREEFGIFNCPNCGAAAGPESVSCTYCGSSLATRVCASCYGAVSVGMHHCPWCGAGTADGQQTVAADRQCPRCAQKLSQVNVGGHPIQECTRCGGLWVDSSTFQEICTHKEEQEAVLGFEAEPDQIPVPETAGGRMYVPCPECGKLMNREQFAGCSHIVVDWCRQHGAWFDRHELRRIVSFIQSGGLKKAREREKLKIEDEKARLRQKQLNLSVVSQSSIEAAVLGEGWKEDPDSMVRLLSSLWRGLNK